VKRLLALASLLGVSCVSVAPTKTAVATPDGWHTSAPNVSASDGDLSRWWTSLGDAELDSLIAEALENNRDLRVATIRVRQARALRRASASRGNPQGDVGAIAAATHSRDELFEIGFDAGWEIDLFGGIRAEVAAASAQIAAVEEARHDVAASLTAEIARNYVELRGAQRRIEVLDARVTTLTETHEIVRARHEAGLVPAGDVARVEALVAATAANRAGLEHAVNAAIHRLGVLHGSEPNALRARLQRSRALPAVTSEVPAGVPGQLLARRPDVRRAEREIAVAAARIGIARADLYPRIVLGGAIGYNDGRLWSIGPSLRWPLLTGGRVRARIEAEEAQRDEAFARFEQTVLRALEDVETALSAYARDDAERARVAAALAAESDAASLARERYRAGLDNFLAVLDVERSVRDYEDRLALVETRLVTSRIAIYKALGGGW
jgi:NodT family efflux transporter outer membrane factor (OMF) lipoprotein